MLKKISSNKGLKINENYYLDENQSKGTSLIIGAAGSGKSSAFFIPNIFKSNENSLVILDHKEEMYFFTHINLEAKGYKTVKIHLSNILENIFNVVNNKFDNINSDNDIENILNDIFDIHDEDDYYNNIEVCLLKAFTKHIKKNKENFIFEDILNLYLETNNLEEFLEEEKDDEYIIKNIKEFLFFTEDLDFISMNKFKEKIKNKFKQNFINKPLEEISFNPLDFSILRKEKIAVYIEADIFDMYKNLFFKKFLEEIFSQMLLYKDGKTVTFFLDEIVSLNKIDNLTKVLKMSEQSNLEICIGIQSFIQLDNFHYNTSEIRHYIKNYIFFTSMGQDLKEYNDLLKKVKDEKSSLTLRDKIKNFFFDFKYKRNKYNKFKEKDIPKEVYKEYLKFKNNYNKYESTFNGFIHIPHKTIAVLSKIDGTSDNYTFSLNEINPYYKD